MSDRSKEVLASLEEKLRVGGACHGHDIDVVISVIKELEAEVEEAKTSSKSKPKKGE